MPVIKTQMYGGSITLVFDSLMHRYTVDGVRIPSVTSILSETSPKPALVFWAANCASDYWKSQIYAGKSYDELQLETIWKDAKRAHTNIKDNSASLGSITHKFVEDYINGEKPELPVNDIARGSCERFMSWVKEHEVKFLSAEQPIYSKEHKYCGTVDFFCVVDGKLYLGDLKTSNAIYSEYLEQVSAYKQARVEEFGKEVFEGCVIVRVGKEDGELEIKYITDTDKYANVFNKRVELYYAAQTIKEK